MFHNEYYELGYNAAINRINWMIKGYWPSVEAVPHFNNHWGEVIKKVKPGFTIMADVRTMKTFPPDVKKLNEQMQVRLMEAGCSKVAYVAESPVAAMQLNNIAKGSGMNKVLQAFSSLEDAQTWIAKKD